jgi:hypothetical protein
MDFLVAVSGYCGKLTRQDTSLLNANACMAGEDHLWAPLMHVDTLLLWVNRAKNAGPPKSFVLLFSPTIN